MARLPERQVPGGTEYEVVGACKCPTLPVPHVYRFAERHWYVTAAYGLVPMAKAPPCAREYL